MRGNGFEGLPVGMPMSTNGDADRLRIQEKTKRKADIQEVSFCFVWPKEFEAPVVEGGTHVRFAVLAQAGAFLRFAPSLPFSSQRPPAV